MPKTRLDQLVVALGLAQSRERARALILAGDVTVGGRPITKAGTFVDDQAEVVVRAADHPWVGRGGLKLDHALDAFHLDVKGRVALDVGASTGGFTDVLLNRGARHVIALDVGHGQLAWRLRTDERVTVIERLNARHLRREDLPPDLSTVDIATIDVSFISLRHILPAVGPIVAPGGHIVALVKPQFEAGRDEVGKGGVITDETIHARVVDEVTRAAREVGLERLGLEPSPVAGISGNREFFLLLAPTRRTAAE
ncbi:MAG TPA: TlyA family RNA methyltransferase [Vicinamibacterales bacterium]|nr:TlyA family RNA methyltransferase [Vicinamibacterales bacterium]